MSLFDWCFWGSFPDEAYLDIVKISATKHGFQRQQPTTFEETQAEKALLSSTEKLVPKRTSVLMITNILHGYLHFARISHLGRTRWHLLGFSWWGPFFGFRNTYGKMCCDTEALKHIEIYLNPGNTQLLSNNILNTRTEYNSQLRKFVKFCFALLWNNPNSSLWSRSASTCFASCSFVSGQAAGATLQNVIMSFGSNHEAFKNKGKYIALSPSPPALRHWSDLLARAEYGAQI